MSENDYARCKTCGMWRWTDSHKCPPIYEVEGDDGIAEHHGRDCEEAAEAYAKAVNEDGDYFLINSEIDIRVRKKGDTEWRTFAVGAEPEVSYWARPQKPEQEVEG